VLFSWPARLAKKRPHLQNDGQGLPRAIGAIFFSDLALRGVVPCPAVVRPSGRAAGQLVRQHVRPLSGRMSGAIFGHFSFFGGAASPVCGPVLAPFALPIEIKDRPFRLSLSGRCPAAIGATLGIMQR